MENDAVSKAGGEKHGKLWIDSNDILTGFHTGRSIFIEHPPLEIIAMHDWKIIIWITSVLKNEITYFIGFFISFRVDDHSVKQPEKSFCY